MASTLAVPTTASSRSPSPVPSRSSSPAPAPSARLSAAAAAPSASAAPAPAAAAAAATVAVPPTNLSSPCVSPVVGVVALAGAAEEPAEVDPLLQAIGPHHHAHHAHSHAAQSDPAHGPGLAHAPSLSATSEHSAACSSESEASDVDEPDQALSPRGSAGSSRNQHNEPAGMTALHPALHTPQSTIPVPPLPARPSPAPAVAAATRPVASPAPAPASAAAAAAAPVGKRAKVLNFAKGIKSKFSLFGSKLGKQQPAKPVDPISAAAAAAAAHATLATPSASLSAASAQSSPSASASPSPAMAASPTPNASPSPLPARAMPAASPLPAHAAALPPPLLHADVPAAHGQPLADSPPMHPQAERGAALLSPSSFPVASPVPSAAVGGAGSLLVVSSDPRAQKAARAEIERQAKDRAAQEKARLKELERQDKARRKEAERVEKEKHAAAAAQAKAHIAMKAMLERAALSNKSAGKMEHAAALPSPASTNSARSDDALPARHPDLLPHATSSPLLGSFASSGSSRPAFARVSSRGPIVGGLRIHVVCGHSINGKDASDPSSHKQQTCVEVTYGGCTSKSEFRTGSDPTYDCYLALPVVDITTDVVIQLVLKHSLKKNEIFAMCVIPLPLILNAKTLIEQTYAEQSKHSSEVRSAESYRDGVRSVSVVCPPPPPLFVPAVNCKRAAAAGAGPPPPPPGATPLSRARALYTSLFAPSRTFRFHHWLHLYPANYDRIGTLFLHRFPAAEDGMLGSGLTRPKRELGFVRVDLQLRLDKPLVFDYTKVDPGQYYATNETTAAATPALDAGSAAAAAASSGAGGVALPALPSPPSSSSSAAASAASSAVHSSPSHPLLIRPEEPAEFHKTVFKKNVRRLKRWLEIPLWVHVFAHVFTWRIPILSFWMLSLWTYVCYRMPVWQFPLFLMLSVFLLNVWIVRWKLQVEHRFVHTYQEDALPYEHAGEGWQMKFKRYKGNLAKTSYTIGRISAQMEKTVNMLNFTDLPLSVFAYAILFTLALMLSTLLLVVPAHTVIYLIGLRLFVKGAVRTGRDLIEIKHPHWAIWNTHAQPQLNQTKAGEIATGDHNDENRSRRARLAAGLKRCVLALKRSMQLCLRSVGWFKGFVRQLLLMLQYLFQRSPDYFEQAHRILCERAIQDDAISSAQQQARASQAGYIGSALAAGGAKLASQSKKLATYWSQPAQPQHFLSATQPPPPSSASAPRGPQPTPTTHARRILFGSAASSPCHAPVAPAADKQRNGSLSGPAGSALVPPMSLGAGARRRSEDVHLPDGSPPLSIQTSLSLSLSRSSDRAASPSLSQGIPPLDPNSARARASLSRSASPVPMPPLLSARSLSDARSSRAPSDDDDLDDVDAPSGDDDAGDSEPDEADEAFLQAAMAAGGAINVGATLLRQRSHSEREGTAETKWYS